MIRQTLLATAALLALAVGAQAAPVAGATLLIDDSDPDFITISANGFQGGLLIDGNVVQIGADAPGTITLPDDSSLLIFASWEDGGATPDFFPGLLTFGTVAGAPDVTSGFAVTGSTDGTLGTISGGIGPLNGMTYPALGPALFGQNDGPQGLAFPFLEITFVPEAVAAVPAPAGLALFGLGLLGLASLRRR
jgi:hypothetical protein